MKSERSLLRSVASLLVLSILFLYSTPFVFSQRNSSQHKVTTHPQRTDVIPEDTIISVRINDYLSSKTSHVGDKFTATVTTPVSVAGQVAIPAGSIVEGRVTQVITAKRMNKSGAIVVDFDTITLPNGLSTQIVGVLTSDNPEIQDKIDEENRMSGGKNKDAGVFIGSSGAIGAILGAISGGAKGAAVGGAIGAGIGLAGVLLNKGEEASVPVGTAFGIRLKQALPSPTDAGNVGTNESGNLSQNDNSVVQNGSQENVNLPLERNQSTTENSQTDSKNREIARATESDGTSSSITKSESSEEIAIPLSSPEMIRRTQIALNEEGYYEGDFNGELNERTSIAIKTYQHDKNLPETGNLDEATARSLKILAKSQASPRQTVRSTVYTSTASDNTDRRISTNPKNPPINSDGAPSNSKSNQSNDLSTGVVRSASTLLKQSQDLLAEYQRFIGVRLTGTGIESNGKIVYTDDDIDLLFALDSFANRVQLYNRLIPSLQTQQGIRSATLAMAKEARRTDRIFTTSSSRWVNNLNPRWDAIRQDVLKLMYLYGISTSEIEN